MFDIAVVCFLYWVATIIDDITQYIKKIQKNNARQPSRRATFLFCYRYKLLERSPARLSFIDKFPKLFTSSPSGRFNSLARRRKERFESERPFQTSRPFFELRSTLVWREKMRGRCFDFEKEKRSLAQEIKSDSIDSSPPGRRVENLFQTFQTFQTFHKKKKKKRAVYFQKKFHEHS